VQRHAAYEFKTACLKLILLTLRSYNASNFADKGVYQAKIVHLEHSRKVVASTIITVILRPFDSDRDPLW
jgi:hypothetical protein